MTGIFSGSGVRGVRGGGGQLQFLFLLTHRYKGLPITVMPFLLSYRCHLFCVYSHL